MKRHVAIIVEAFVDEHTYGASINSVRVEDPDQLGEANAEVFGAVLRAMATSVHAGVYQQFPEPLPTVDPQADQQPGDEQPSDEQAADEPTDQQIDEALEKFPLEPEPVDQGPFSPEPDPLPIDPDPFPGSDT